MKGVDFLFDFFSKSSALSPLRLYTGLTGRSGTSPRGPAPGTAGAPVHVPTADEVGRSQMTRFVRHLEARTGRSLPDWPSLHHYSVAHFREFWALFLEWSAISWSGEPDPVCVGDNCEHAVFFPQLRLNYTENLVETGEDGPAITSVHENGDKLRLTRSELRRRVGCLASALEDLGLRPGDRVAAVCHNSAEGLIACLAVTGLGATFSAASPDMGAFAMLSRFKQLHPRLLICNLRDAYEGVRGQLRERLAEVVAALPSLSAVVILDDASPPSGLQVPYFALTELLDGRSERTREWVRFPFNHPLFVLFSSGTTGAPKCIVHGAGGTLLEHVKELRLHCDLSPSDKLFFQTSCGWMMWNWQLSALACGTEIVLYDGSIGEPETLWRIVSNEEVTVFGTNPGFLQYCAEAGYRPREHVGLPRLRAILSTGSILFDKQFDWVDDHVKHLPLQSISGGTDIIGCFVLGNPNLPVYRGESQCKSLGLDVRAWLNDRAASIGEIGELICANPFPSRPIGLHGDPGGDRFHRAYFSQTPGVWTHGDFIQFTDRDTARLHGRSDGVLNIRGIRIGPAEIYRILQDFEEIREAMAIEQELGRQGGTRLVLLVVLRAGLTLDDALTLRIKRQLSRHGSPAHVPAVIAQVRELPTTHSGKRSERAAYNALNGRNASNVEALKNPEVLGVLRDHPTLRIDPID